MPLLCARGKFGFPMDKVLHLSTFTWASLTEQSHRSAMLAIAGRSHRLGVRLPISILKLHKSSL